MSVLLLSRGQRQRSLTWLEGTFASPRNLSRNQPQPNDAAASPIPGHGFRISEGRRDRSTDYIEWMKNYRSRVTPAMLRECATEPCAANAEEKAIA
jgi:hypothetical protein